MAALGRAQVAQSLRPLIQAATWSGSLEALEPKSLAIFKLSTLRFQLLALSCLFWFRSPRPLLCPRRRPRALRCLRQHRRLCKRDGLAGAGVSYQRQPSSSGRAGGSWRELLTTPLAGDGNDTPHTQLQLGSWRELTAAVHTRCQITPIKHLVSTVSAALSGYLPPYLVICRPIWLSAAKSG